MSVRLLISTMLLLLLAGWGERGLDWPHAGPMPDEAVAVPAWRYEPIGAGNRSYRPVEPMPWGDINKRVAPPVPESKPAPAEELGPTPEEKK